MTELRASILTRLSKKASAANLSLDGGLQDCRRVAVQLNAAIIAERVDNGVSGSIRQRKGLQAWLKDATSGHADILIAPHSDRITRTGLSSQSGQIMDMLKGLDPDSGKQVRPPIRLVTVSSSDGGRIDTSLPGGLEKLEQEFQAAAVELRRITQRNRQTRQRMIDAERYVGGAVPTGCRVTVRDGGKFLEADPRWAPMIRRAAEQIVAYRLTDKAEGRSIRAVCVEWNAVGFKPYKADQWQASTVRLTLLSEATGKYILGPALAAELRDALESGPKAKRGRPQRRILAGGNGVCHSCRRNLSSGGGRYKCPSFTSGKSCDDPVTINAPHADEVVERRFLDRFGRLPYLELRIEVDGVNELDEAVVAEEQAQAELLANPGAETLASYQAAQASLAELRARSRNITRTYVDAGVTIAERWLALSTEEKRAELSEALAEPVVIMPNIGTNRTMSEERIVTVWRDEVE